MRVFQRKHSTSVSCNSGKVNVSMGTYLDKQ